MQLLLKHKRKTYILVKEIDIEQIHDQIYSMTELLGPIQDRVRRIEFIEKNQLNWFQKILIKLNDKFLSRKSAKN